MISKSTANEMTFGLTDLLRSDVSSSWPTLMNVLHAMLRVHFDSRRASKMDISMQVQTIRDILVAVCYALSMESIAGFVLESHAPSTWAEFAAWLEMIFSAEAEDEGRPGVDRDPGDTLQGYIMTIGNLLREQAIALRGKAWAHATLPLAQLKIGFEDDPVIGVI